MAEIIKRMILMSGGEKNAPTPALLKAIEDAGAIVVADTTAAAFPQAVAAEDENNDGPVLAVLCEINKGVSTDELRQKVAHATSKWAGVPVIAYHPYEYDDRDVATQNGHRTNGLLLKYLGFQAVIEDPSQLLAALHEAEEQQQQPAAHARGAEAATTTTTAAAAPTENELGEALLELARCPENLSPQNLRTAFEIVSALHFAGDRKQAAQTAIAGLKRLVEADHWAIYAVAEESAGTPASKLELLVGLTTTTTTATSGQDPHVDLWQDSQDAVLEAVEKVESVQRTKDGRHVVAVPLVYAERVYGALEVKRSLGLSSSSSSSSAAAPFTVAELDTLSFLMLPVASALANAERIAKAEQLSLTDDLTKLHNARYLRDFLASEVKRARRYNSPVAVIFIDLDNFKKVNDVHGHLTGSHVLSELGGVILGSVRDTDVVARYGGDEFVVVLPQSQAEQAVFVAERMRERIARQIFSGGRGLSLRVTASIGVTAFPQKATTPQQLLDSADAAMYVAKAQSKNCVRLAPEFSSQNFNENVFSQ